MQCNKQSHKSNNNDHKIKHTLQCTQRPTSTLYTTCTLFCSDLIFGHKRILLNVMIIGFLMFKDYNQSVDDDDDDRLTAFDPGQPG